MFYNGNEKVCGTWKRANNEDEACMMAEMSLICHYPNVSYTSCEVVSETEQEVNIYVIEAMSESDALTSCWCENADGEDGEETYIAMWIEELPDCEENRNLCRRIWGEQ